MTFHTDPLFYALAITGVLALGISKGGFNGVGQIATPLLALIMPPLEAAAIFLPIMIVQDVTAMWVYRKDWNGRILAIMIPGGLAGIAAAGFLAAHISDGAVRIFIGVTTIAFVLYWWIGPARVARDIGSTSVAGGTFWGALSGFTSTIAQAGGPPFQIYVLSRQLPKMTYVGTVTIFFGTLNFFKTIPFFLLGQFTPTGFATSMALLPLAIAFNFLGFWLVRITPERLFYRITMILLFLISLELLRSGVTEIWRG